MNELRLVKKVKDDRKDFFGFIRRKRRIKEANLLGVDGMMMTNNREK